MKNKYNVLTVKKWWFLTVSEWDVRSAVCVFTKNIDKIREEKYFNG